MTFLIFIFSLISFSHAQICQNNDRRELSYKSEVGRIRSQREWGMVCTATLISPNCAVSAGHCRGAMDIMEFQVPLSDENGKINSAEHFDQYKIREDSIRLQNGGMGKDWAVFCLDKNPLTGQDAGERQGFLKVNFKKLKKEEVSIYGYGLVENPRHKNHVQQVHRGRILQTGSLLFPGRLSHNVDVTGGNSGSALLNKDDEIVGIHSHQSCETVGGSFGVMIDGNRLWQQALREVISYPTKENNHANY